MQSTHLAPFGLPNTSSAQLFPPTTHRESRPISSLGPILRDPSFFFHSIYHDITKLPSIFAHGVLTAADMRKHNLPLAFTYGSPESPALNGWDRVSLTLSPSHPDSPGYDRGAFGLFAKKQLTFIISNFPQHPLFHLPSLPEGEVQSESISPRKIIGLLVPNKFHISPISDINFLARGSLSTLHMRCQRAYQFIRKTYDLENSHLLEQVASPITKENQESIQAAFNDFITEGFCKYFQKNPTSIPAIDALRTLIPPQLPLYDELGVSLQS